MKGLLITLEGPDGCGKSTQIEALKKYFEEEGREVLVTREPGGTKISEDIREVILNPDNMEMDPVTELLLYASARAQLVAQVLKPAYEAGKVILCDRFIDSSAVYQGIARGLGTDTVYKVNEYAIQGLVPDLTIHLDLPYEVGLSRKKSQHDLDRMELMDKDFHMKVAEGYRTLAKENADRIVTVDATKDKDVITGEILKIIEGL